jgi:hypothetical protein
MRLISDNLSKPDSNGRKREERVPNDQRKTKHNEEMHNLIHKENHKWKGHFY